MRLVHTSIDMSLENNARTNAGTYRHVNQPRLIPSRSPAGFTQSGGIGIILHCDGHAEYLLQILGWILPPPMGKEVHVTDFAGEWIHRPRRPDSNALEVGSSTGHGCSQHVRRAIECTLVGAIRLCRCFETVQYLALRIHDPYRNL